MTERDPHGGAQVLTGGRPLADARAAVILVHGRGGTAENILSLAAELQHPDVAYVAPQASGYSWYPESFLVPIERNQPFLDSALELLRTLLDRVLDVVPSERVVLLGFSQGACLTVEFAARDARRYGGVIAFTGGLIGPDVERKRYSGSFDGTPVFLGSSDPDPHVPAVRVAQTRDVLASLGAEVTMRLYPNMGHTINVDELEQARAILERASG
jgi:phospholipase/carboxylesterase